MTTTNGVKILFGGGKFFDSDAKETEEWLDALEKNGVKNIDTATIYGKSQEVLGQTKAAERFNLDTKYPGGFGGNGTTEDVIKTGQASLDALQVKSDRTIDVYYIHAPARKTPLKETLAGINELYQKKAFKRFGLSNYSAEEIEEVFKVAKENNFVTPSVYQGNYSAVARRTETEIFPTIRKYNISFYAYSPIAGGFLSKSPETLKEKGGRFHDDHPFGKLYNAIYNKPNFVEALNTWGKLAEDEGITRAELAYRWIVYHSELKGNLGDGVIIGARDIKQLDETVTSVKGGKLKPSTVEGIEKIWDSIKADAALDNFEHASG